jgi:hypothetical protein
MIREAARMRSDEAARHNVRLPTIAENPRRMSANGGLFRQIALVFASNPCEIAA